MNLPALSEHYRCSPLKHSHDPVSGETTYAELESHLQALKLPAPGIEYVLAVASAPPSRRVGTHRRRNFIVDVPLPRFGVVIQAESASGEYFFLLETSRRREVKAIFDQPKPIHLMITNRRGIRTPIEYTADYLIISEEFVTAYEVKADKDLADLCEARPVDWERNNTGFNYLPASRHYETMGIRYSVVPNSSISSVRGENLRLLSAIQHVDNSPTLQKLRTKAWNLIRSVEAIQVGDVLARLGVQDATAVMQLLDQGLVYADLDQQLLTSPAAVWVSTNPEIPSLLKRSGSRLSAALDAKQPVSTAVVSNPSHHSEIALRYALCGLVQEPDFDVLASRSKRSLRRYRKLLRDSSGDPRSLFPKWNRSGNKLLRKPAAHYDLMHAVILNSQSDPNLSTNANSYLAYLSAFRTQFGGASEVPFAESTFYRHCFALARQQSSSAARGGRRMGNANAATIDPRHRGMLATRAFSIAHIDHWNVDLQLVVCTLDGQRITQRPWLTAMVDSYSGEVLGLWLTFRAPSREACSMVVRDCVRRHGRLPEMLVVDGGSEFDSVQFAAMLAEMRITRANRPPEDPRFGQEAERLFGGLKERFARGLPGFIEGVASARKVSGAFSASNRAELRLHELLEAMESYVFRGYNLSPKPGCLESRAGLRAQSDALFPFSGSKVAWNTEFLIRTSVEAPRETYALSPGRGVRVLGRWYSGEGLVDYRGFKKDLKVRIDPFDHAVVYACIDGKWHVCRSTDAVMHAAISEYEVIADTAQHQQLRGLIRSVALEATRCAYESKMGALKAIPIEKPPVLPAPTAPKTQAALSKPVRRIKLDQIADLPLDEDGA